MKEINYTQLLTNEDKVRIYFKKHRGKITKFVVQYFSLINKRWRSIMGIDNCHGYPHKHTYHLQKKEYVVLLAKNNNIAFTEAKHFVLKDFKKVKENFLLTK